MSLARALTKRLGRSDSSASAISATDAPARSFSQRKAIKPDQISLPINLLSTTNMLSYDAPDIAAMQKRAQASVQEIGSATSSSRASSDEPTPGLTTDGSSVESSPTVEYNHLSCYFPGPALKRSPSAKAIAKADSDVPALPQRAPSHSKREHERMARKRSIRSSASSSLSQRSSPRTSVDPAFSAAATAAATTSLSSEYDTPSSTSITTPPLAHPFSQELERLNEVAEEFSGVSVGWDAEEDAAVMASKGLEKVSATEYLDLMTAIWPMSPYVVSVSSTDDYIGEWI